MNDLLIQSQKIAEKIGKQIPKPAYKAAYLACRNQCLPQMEINVATQQYKECCTQIANAIELSYDIGVVIASIAEQIQEMIKSMVLNIQYAVQSMSMLNLEFVNSHKKLYDRLLFY